MVELEERDVRIGPEIESEFRVGFLLLAWVLNQACAVSVSPVDLAIALQPA